MSYPFKNKKLYVDPHSFAMNAMNDENSELIKKIALQPQSIWLNGDLDLNLLKERLAEIEESKCLPVFVAYNIPNRDLGSHSAGGAKDMEAYKEWIKSLRLIIEKIQSVVILEPDALAHIKDIKSEEALERINLLTYALSELKRNSQTSVYVDASHPRWHSVEEMGNRLKLVGIEYADGFAINVSNFVSTEECIQYGEGVSSFLGGKHFVIDTSRNGLGPKTVNGQVEWCNPDGRALGIPPSTDTQHDLVDAFLWIKRPGESDGECNGGPFAGQWWLEYALGLAQRTSW